MDKIAEVKRAFKELKYRVEPLESSCHAGDNFYGRFAIGGNRIEALQAAISALDEPEKVDLKADFIKAGWAYSHSISDSGICSDHSCYRCRLSALLFETEGKEPENVEPIDLSDLRVGDEVEDYAKGWGVVDQFAFTNRYPILVRFPGKTSREYTSNGKYWETDVRPSIIAVRRKKRTVEKTRTVDINEMEYEEPENGTL